MTNTFWWGVYRLVRMPDHVEQVFTLNMHDSLLKTDSTLLLQDEVLLVIPAIRDHAGQLNTTCALWQHPEEAPQDTVVLFPNRPVGLRQKPIWFRKQRALEVPHNPGDAPTGQMPAPACYRRMSAGWVEPFSNAPRSGSHRQG